MIRQRLRLWRLAIHRWKWDRYIQRVLVPRAQERRRRELEREIAEWDEAAIYVPSDNAQNPEDYE